MDSSVQEELIKQATTALNISYIQRDIVEIKQAQKETSLEMKTALKAIADKDESFVKKEEFIFWRNLLVTGMIGTIFIGIVMSAIK